jgi:hypothetical protein
MDLSEPTSMKLSAFVVNKRRVLLVILLAKSGSAASMRFW